MNDIVQERRMEWLRDFRRSEGDVMWDDEGQEFIIDIRDDGSKKRVYVPPHLRIEESI